MLGDISATLYSLNFATVKYSKSRRPNQFALNCGSFGVWLNRRLSGSMSHDKAQASMSFAWVLWKDDKNWSVFLVNCEMVQWLSQTMRKLNVNDLTLLSLNSQPKQGAVVWKSVHLCPLRRRPSENSGTKFDFTAGTTTVQITLIDYHISHNEINLFARRWPCCILYSDFLFIYYSADDFTYCGRCTPRKRWVCSAHGNQNSLGNGKAWMDYSD